MKLVRNYEYDKTIVPPIKSQGIKTKLVPWINDIIRRSGLDLGKTNWIEPFLVLAWLA